MDAINLLQDELDRATLIVLVNRLYRLYYRTHYSFKLARCIVDCYQQQFLFEYATTFTSERKRHSIALR